MPTRDEKAVDILLRSYWSSEGWRDPPMTAPDDLAYAKAAEVMFDGPLSATHDEVVAGVVRVAASLSPGDVGAAFLASLTSRRLELRSALGSYAVARHLAEHELMPWEENESGTNRNCAVCGVSEVEAEIARNVFSFERYKWGGVRRDDLTYVWFDLQRLRALDERPQPTDEDVAIFRQLIDALERQPDDVTAPRAEAALRLLPSNKAERETVLDILGVCGVLETTQHRGYSERFIRADERELPPLRFVERAYPVCWWRGSDGVNRRALAAFGLPTT